MTDPATPSPLTAPSPLTTVAHLPIATVAAGQYRKRQQQAQAVVANRGMLAAQAERHLRPWLAIACLCGADLPELAALLALRRAQIAPDVVSGAAYSPQQMAAARWLAADDICPRQAWVPVLAAARDQAFTRFLANGQDTALAANAAALQRLCLHLAYDPNGCPVPAFPAVAERSAAEPPSNAVAGPVAERSEAENPAQRSEAEPHSNAVAERSEAEPHSKRSAA